MTTLFIFSTSKMNNCEACGRWMAKWGCNVCGTTTCSKQCEEYYSPIHQVVCHHEKGDRLMSIVEYITHLNGRDIGGPFWQPTINLSKVFVLSESRILRPSDTRISLGNTTCVICSVATSNRNFQQLYYTTRRGLIKSLVYILCNHCRSQGLQLCDRYLRCTSKCTSTFGWWTFLMCLHRVVPWIPKDIKQILFQLIKPCNHPVSLKK